MDHILPEKPKRMMAAVVNYWHFNRTVFLFRSIFTQLGTTVDKDEMISCSGAKTGLEKQACSENGLQPRS